MLWHMQGKKTNNSDFCFSLQTQDIVQCWKTRPVWGFYHQDSFRSIVVLCWWGSVMYKTASASIYHAMCQYCWLAVFGEWFHGIHSAPWWKWRNATGYLNIRGSQEHPFIVPACTSANWFPPAGTCPRHKTTNASMNRTVKSAYCTNLLSH